MMLSTEINCSQLDSIISQRICNNETIYLPRIKHMNITVIMVNNACDKNINKETCQCIFAAL